VRLSVILNRPVFKIYLVGLKDVFASNDNVGKFFLSVQLVTINDPIVLMYFFADPVLSVAGLVFR
jgi:hypothetical protein